MRKITLFFALILALAAAAQENLPAAFAAPQAQANLQSAGTSPLCIPSMDALQDTDCQKLGPAAYLEQLSAEGLTLPRPPLPAVRVDAAFAELPYRYVRLLDQETPIFSSLDSALANQNPYRTIPAGFNFVTYVDFFQNTGGARQYMIEPGMWIRGGSTGGQVAPSEFSGLVFAGTPDHKFGWVLYETNVQPAPGASASSTVVRKLTKFDLIEVYQTMEADGTTWLMIGPEEWIDTTTAALVYPATEPPQGVDNGRWIEVNLKEQTLSVYQNNRLVLATLTSTGIAGWWTRPGLFQIFEKVESTPMSGAFEADRSDYYYLEDVPWTMYFDEARALHGAYWHNYFGYEQSHGCVNLSPADSHWLYLWANLGDYVYVWDPSGKTPTDPSLYTAGGA
jgi:hypothetical protein